MSRKFKPKDQFLAFLQSNPSVTQSDSSLAAAVLHMVRGLSTLEIKLDDTTIVLGGDRRPLSMTLRDVGIELGDWLSAASDESWTKATSAQGEPAQQVMRIGPLLIRMRRPENHANIPESGTETLCLDVLHRVDRRALSRVARRWVNTPSVRSTN